MQSDQPLHGWFVLLPFVYHLRVVKNARQTFPHLTAAELKEEQEKVEGQLKCIWTEANLDVAACWSEFGQAFTCC